jgi:hypothetical protein
MVGFFFRINKTTIHRLNRMHTKKLYLSVKVLKTNGKENNSENTWKQNKYTQ